MKATLEAINQMQAAASSGTTPSAAQSAQRSTWNQPQQLIWTSSLPFRVHPVDW